MRVARADPNALTPGANIAVKCTDCVAGDTSAACTY